MEILEILEDQDLILKAHNRIVIKVYTYARPKNTNKTKQADIYVQGNKLVKSF